MTVICVNLMYLQDRSPYMENSGSSNDRNSGKTEYQLTLIDALKKEIEIARRLDPEKLAAEIKKLVFPARTVESAAKELLGGITG